MVNESRLVEHFLSLCRVNTPPRRERILVDLVQAELEAMGLTCVRDAAHEMTGGDCGNLIATMQGTVLGAAPIFFSAHFDTVEPNPDVQIRIEAGIIRTDGTSILGADDKGGMAPIIEAMRVLQECSIPRPEIQLLLTVSEEIGLLGAKHLDLGLVRARSGYVLDTGPPVGNVVNTAPDQDSMEVTIVGRPAHAGFEPERGISAIQVAASAIERMKLGRLDFETTANVGVISGGNATNIVCPEVRIRAEARSRDSAKLHAQVQHMVECFNAAAQDFGAKAEIVIKHQYDTYCLDADHPVIGVAQQAARAIGLDTSLREAGGGSDANVLNARGLPTCVLGTGMRNIHTHEECIAISDLVRTAEWVVEIARCAAAKEVG